MTNVLYFVVELYFIFYFTLDLEKMIIWLAKPEFFILFSFLSLFF